MSKLTKKIIIGGIIAVLIGLGFVFGNQNDAEIVDPVVEEEPFLESNWIVEVKGEVNKPGLYFLGSDARVNDAIILAGGLTMEADTDNLNLASRITDGMVIFVPGKSGTAEYSKISINSGSLDELMSLSGIGEVKARSIIDYRNLHGPFSSLEELKNVEGISEKLFDQIKAFICL